MLALNCPTSTRANNLIDNILGSTEILIESKSSTRECCDIRSAATFVVLHHPTLTRAYNLIGNILGSTEIFIESKSNTRLCSDICSALSFVSVDKGLQSDQ
jgi:hypothetical protein